MVEPKAFGKRKRLWMGCVLSPHRHTSSSSSSSSSHTGYVQAVCASTVLYVMMRGCAVKLTAPYRQWHRGQQRHSQGSHKAAPPAGCPQWCSDGQQQQGRHVADAQDCRRFPCLSWGRYALEHMLWANKVMASETGNQCTGTPQMPSELIKTCHQEARDPVSIMGKNEGEMNEV